MDSITPFKYDVAFSFLHKDEIIAFQVNDLIQDRLETFIYSKKQEELVGTDGEIKFNDVFFKDSRIVVVLYREGWGQTPWTRIEETAIKNRAFESGWDFLLLVNLDTTSKLPAWIPKPYIWHDFERWKPEGLPPIIEYRVKQAGGHSRPESIEDKAKRFRRLKIAVEERNDFLKYGAAIEAANEEVKIIIELLKTSKTQLEDSSSNFLLRTGERPNQMYEFGHDDYFLCFNALDGFQYDISECKLIATIYQKIGHYGLNYSEKRFQRIEYKFDRDLMENNIWTSGPQSYTSKELVHKWVSDFIKILEEKEKKRK